MQKPRRIMFRDRDYILDNLGNFLRIVGDHHVHDIVSYVKYFPSEYGVKIIRGKPYAFNSFVPRSLAILGESPGRIQFSSQTGTVMSVTPIHEVSQVFNCRAKVLEILESREIYLAHSVGKYLIYLLDIFGNSIDLSNIGITGSFLIDGYDDGSDIDLVCYGLDTSEAVKKIFHDSSTMSLYQGKDALPLYKRRMQHMANLDFETLIIQENRKNQGFIGTQKIHVNCQPLREDETPSIFSSFSLVEVGYISCILQIENDSEGVFAPAYYDVSVIEILDSLHVGILNLKEKVEFLICILGTYSGVFVTGDKVFVDGKLIQLTSKSYDHITYGIEISSLNNNRIFSASLLR
jgi:predicted nucleotidyltransferase